jgi:zinc protease
MRNHEVPTHAVASRLRRTLAPALVALCLLPATLRAAVQETLLDNGLKVVVQEDHRSPTVVSQLWYRCGSIDEFNGTTGVAHVLEHMMFKGTEAVPAGQFSKIIAAAGGRDNAFTSMDHTTYFQQLEKSRLELALKMEADRMNHLTFSEKEFAPEMKVIMEERRMRTDDKPHAMVAELMSASMFVAHPYRHPIIGWMSDLETMKLADARAWYERWYAPNNAVLVVVGDVQPEEVFALAKKYFGPLPFRALPERKAQVEPEQLGTRRIRVKATAELPYLALGWHVPVLKEIDRDWEPFALEVLSAVLDGNESARLPRALVKGDRIASNVDVGYDPIRRGPGVFVVDGTPSEGRSVDELEAAIKREIDRIKQDGITAEELDRVKAQVVAAHVFQRDSMFYQGMQIGTYETTGFSWKDVDRVLERLRAVTGDQVRDVARRYFVDEHMTVAVLDPRAPETKRADASTGGQHAK